MGFLEREQKLREREIAVAAAEKAKHEAERLKNEEIATLKRWKEEEDRIHGPEDNGKIIELLDALPEFAFLSYLNLVKKHTGYSSSLYIYTRDKGFIRDKRLKEKLMDFSIPTEGYDSPRGPIHPYEMFCGTHIEPKSVHYGGFMSLFPTKKSIFEPQEPGIGICFEKKNERIIGNYTRRDSTYSFNIHEFEISETKTQFVFIRLLAPATAFITGNGQKVPITSMEVLDNAIEEGFKHYHVGKVRQEREIDRDIAS